MTDRRFVYAVDLGGGFYDLQIQQSTDEVLNMLADSLLPGVDQILTTNNLGVIATITVEQNEMVIKAGTNSLEAVAPSVIRGILNVENDADQNLAANVGGGIGIWRDISSPDPAIINLRSLIAASARRIKLIQNTDTVTVDAVITPFTYNLTGNSRIAVGTTYPLFKTEQAMTIDALSAVIVPPSPATSNEDLGFTILSNTTMSTIGATTNVDMTGANALIDIDDSLSGVGRGSHDQNDSSSRILVPAIAANSWVMIDIISKTDPLDAFGINLFLQNT